MASQQTLQTAIRTYNGNSRIKAEGVKMEFTQHEVLEYARCARDPAYFARTYCKIISLDHGVVPFDLYPYQEKMYTTFNENRFNIMLACRQSGKSIGCVAYLLWYAIFQDAKKVAILANKHATAKEMLSRITLMLENLPFFLQPGCKALNKSSIEFDNDSEIIAASTSSASIRGLSINLLYLDEFAFVQDAATFYTSTYPVITAGTTTKVIITSTANGIGNMFHKIWEGAVQRTNTFKAIRVDWWDVPGRDEAWKEETIANTSQMQFDQEYGNTFFGTGDTLINGETLLSLRAIEPIERREQNLLNIYRLPIKGHKYICTVDVAKGRGQDYSTFNIVDISTTPFQQCAVYRDNLISPLLYPNVIHKYCKLYNNAYCIVESNDQGAVVANGLYHELEYEEMHLTSTVKSGCIGIEMNRRTKRLGCSGFKDLLEENKLEVHDEECIREISTFEAKGQSYEASDNNHDDIVMNLVMLGYFVQTPEWLERTDIDIRNMMYKQRMHEIDMDIPDFGFVDDGIDEPYIDPQTVLDSPWALDHAQDDWNGW